MCVGLAVWPLLSDEYLLLLLREPPFQVFFVAAFSLVVVRLFRPEHPFSALEKVLLCEGQPTALASVLLDCGVVV